MRLATFNLLHGRSLSDGMVDPARFAETIRSLDADILAIQEVDHNQPRSGRLDLAAIAADALGARHYRFVPTIVGTPGGVYRPFVDDADAAGEPTYGNALISRWPIVDWQIRRLARAPLRAPAIRFGQAGGRTRLVLIRDEPRAVVAALIDSPRGPVTVASAHLSFVPGWSTGHLVTTLRWLGTRPGPRFLLGDLNTPATALDAIAGPLGWHRLGRGRTFPSPRPVLQLDHVLSGTRVPARSFTPVAEFSDHRPLVVELD